MNKTLKHTVRMKLNQKSILKAADELDRLALRLWYNTNLIVDQLTVYAAAKAAEKYEGTVQVTYDTTDAGDHIGKVYATAEDIFVKEFGAGYAVDETHPLKRGAEESGIKIYPGSWSEENWANNVPGGGQFWEHHLDALWAGKPDDADNRRSYWIHGSGRDAKKYTEIEPMYGMYEAWGSVWQNYEETAKELILRD